MRVQVRTVLKPGCVICKRNNCGTDKICPNIDSVHITRHLKKILDHVIDVIILEDYRCMPLLGDEDKVPNWDVHIVKYTVVFVTKNVKERTCNQYF